MCYCSLSFQCGVVFSVFAFISFCWPWSCLSSEVTISVYPLGIFDLVMWRLWNFDVILEMMSSVCLVEFLFHYLSSFTYLNSLDILNRRLYCTARVFQDSHKRRNVLIVIKLLKRCLEDLTFLSRFILLLLPKFAETYCFTPVSYYSPKPSLEYLMFLFFFLLLFSYSVLWTSPTILSKGFVFGGMEDQYP